MRPEHTLSRAASGLRPADHTLRFALLICGAAFAGVTYTFEAWLGLLIGGIVIGYAFRPESDRYYMEGFSAGVESGAALADERNAARLADTRESLRWYDDGATDGGARQDQQPAGAPDPIGRWAVTGGVLEERTRPARPPLDDEGRPIPVAGPRAPAFPERAARGTRSVDLREEGGSEARREADTGERKGAA